MMATSASQPELDRRKSERTEVDEIAYIAFAGSSTRCRVLNISSDGAAVEVPNAAYIPACFELMTERDRVIRTCKVAWISGNRLGIEFETASRLPRGLVTHRERQFLQYLSNGEWQLAIGLSGGERLVAKLLRYGWIEETGTGRELAYRITPRGSAAKTIPVKL